MSVVTTAEPVGTTAQGLAKAVLAGVGKAVKFPGGIIFPMLFAGSAVGSGIMQMIPSRFSLDAFALIPVSVMAGTQSVVNNTPWGTVLLVLGTHSGGNSVSTLVCVSASVIVAEACYCMHTLFPTQKNRTELVHACIKNE